jgi:uncharacterized protein YbjT (DUF2867 family)
MRILITGANGFIGSHLTTALVNAGHDVIACVRNADHFSQNFPNVTIIEADFTQALDSSDWIPHLQDIDIVINAVGIIRETGQQTFKDLHTKAPCALFKAAEASGIKKIIQISALGADKTAFSQYHLTKRDTDNLLIGLKTDWAILLPSIVYGPGAKSMALFKALATLPLIPLIERGDQPIQPIHIDDFSKAVLQLLEPNAPKQLSIEMVGPEPITMKELYKQLRHWFALGQAHMIHLPYSLSLSAAKMGGFLGNTPITHETVQMLQRGNTAEVAPFIAQFGFKPRSFTEYLNQTPSQIQDHWYAKLYFLQPLLRISLAYMWIFTGLVSLFIFPIEQSYAMLAKAGISGLWAPILLFGAAILDVLLGIATLFAYRLSFIGSIQIAIIILYSVIITFSQPELWAHPFGPVSKNIPLIIMTLTMIALERRR